MTGLREWDMRVIWIVKRQRWWWNAWRESTSTELWGFAESHGTALRAMTVAMQNQAEAAVGPCRRGGIADEIRREPRNATP